MKISNKYVKMIKEINIDCDGYWAYSKDGYYFSAMDNEKMGAHIAHEITQKKFLKVIMSLRSGCVCSKECEEVTNG